ncbi:MAG TPA: hypothetical protein VL123_08290 [Candidatus Udaeobacter sp.]|jgi:signal transduction histidine kinase|nr:hypothetical protein [Candidatus Udaeobacter sp.]
MNPDPSNTGEHLEASHQAVNGDADAPAGRIWRRNRRDHALASLVELNTDLANSTDIFDTARLLLLALMGQLGTSKGMVWMHSESEASLPVLLAAHGISKPLARAVVAASSVSLWRLFSESSAPVGAWDIDGGIGYATSTLIQEAGLVLFAPARAAKRFVIVCGLGPPFGQHRYGRVEMSVLEASMAVAGVSFANLDGHAWQAESIRRLRSENEEFRRREELNARGMSELANAARTPISVLRGCLEQILERAGQSERAAVEVARASTRKIESLLDWLSVPPDVDRLMKDAHLDGAELRQVLDDFYRDRAASAACARCELVLNVPEALPDIHCDAPRFSKMLHRLFDEALRYTRAGNSISVRVSVEESDPGTELHVAFTVGDRVPQVEDEHAHGSFDLDTGWGRVRRAGLEHLSGLANEFGARIEIRGLIGDGGALCLMVPVEIGRRKKAA